MFHNGVSKNVLYNFITFIVYNTMVKLYKGVDAIYGRKRYFIDTMEDW